CPEAVAGPSYYATLAGQGLEYGTSFQGIAELWRQDGEAIARLQLPESVAAELERYQIHPALLDACFQTLGATLPGRAQSGTLTDPTLPVGLSHLSTWRRPGGELWAHCRLAPAATPEADGVEADISLLDATGQIMLEIRGLRAQRLARDARRLAQSDLHSWLYALEWQPQPRQHERPAPIPSPAFERGAWLIFAEDRGVGIAL